jgi:hypothetical protein
MSPQLILGETYTREEIHQKLSGDQQSYLPHVDGRVVCACLRPDSNPEAPRTLLVGEGDEIQHWGRQLTQQNGPIPVFVRADSHARRIMECTRSNPPLQTPPNWNVTKQTSSSDKHPSLG